MMRTTVSRMLACLALPLAAFAVPANANQDRSTMSSWAGTWRNTNNTVHIRAAPCGAKMCATVIWANDQTKAAVAAKGRNIIGMQLLRDFRDTGSGEWRGTVYIPDMNMTVSGKLTMLDRNTLLAEGCGFLGLVCQTRHWSRIS